MITPGATLDSTALVDRLSASLGQPFALWRQVAGGPVEPDSPCPQAESWAPLIRKAVRVEQTPWIEPLDGHYLVAFRWLRDDTTLVAAGLFPGAGVDSQAGWTPVALQQAAQLAVQAELAERRRQSTQQEAALLSENLASTYEEISLLHGLTRRLQLSQNQQELTQLALEWLYDCLPAESVFLNYEPLEELAESLEVERIRPLYEAMGPCCLSIDQRREFGQQLDIVAHSHREFMRGGSEVNHRPMPGVKNYLAVPLCDRDHRLGWLVALNNAADDSFGSIEASLMRSVSTILGIHFANREHYEQQANLVAEVVRALASALDAKDPYTRGHSERVAQISTVLGRRLGIDEESLRTIYIGGLLHDIGKIGVDDQVLRKEGKLTDDEFEQIKQHPRLGYNILQDLKPLADVLPIVLHHHERWDGGGYPDRLAGEDTSLHARIAAVADSFDAMTSDRPYRRGMPLEKVEAILRDGAGSQWDPQVIDAFFESRDEIVSLIWKREQQRTPQLA